MAQHGLPEAQRADLALGVLAADVRALEEARRRTLGEVPAGLLDMAEVVAPPVAALAPEPRAPARPLASELVEPYFERRERLDRATHQVMGQERGTLRRFLEVCGDRPVDCYGRGDVKDFLDTLRRLPKTYGKSSKRDNGRTLAEIIAEADAKAAERLTDKTVKRHLSALSQFFRLAMDGGHVTNAQRQELVEGHRFREERGARNQRDAWTSEELKALFSSPVWTGCHPYFRAQAGGEVIRDAKFWLPILALYHGARLEELADLYGRDVWCDGGIWAVRIVETEDNPESGDRRLKTKNATRVVPLHPEVVRLGFLEYVRDTAADPDAPLFPDLAPQGKDGKRGPRVTRWFVNYRRQTGLYREGVAHHAFRHTAITRLSDAITTWQQKRHRDFMMGHGGGGTEGDVRYDKGAGLKAAAETLALLRYPEVDLSHLYTRPPQAEGSAQADAA